MIQGDHRGPNRDAHPALRAAMPPTREMHNREQEPAYEKKARTLAASADSPWAVLQSYTPAPISASPQMR